MLDTVALQAFCPLKTVKLEIILYKNKKSNRIFEFLLLCCE